MKFNIVNRKIYKYIITSSLLLVFGLIYISSKDISPKTERIYKELDIEQKFK